MTQFTKKAIVESFLKLLNQKPLDKISVKDLVDDCGINRNTFYYHFEDMHALLVFVIDEEVEHSLAEHNTIESLEAGFTSVARFALQNKKAVYHIYNSVNRVELERYLNSVAEGTIRPFVEKEGAKLHANPDDTELLIHFYKCGLVGIVTSWLESGMKTDSELLIRKLGQLLEGSVERLLVK